MKVKYFSDTDTALLEFTDNPVAETREISENIYADLDQQGNLVSMNFPPLLNAPLAGMRSVGRLSLADNGGGNRLCVTPSQSWFSGEVGFPPCPSEQ